MNAARNPHDRIITPDTDPDRFTAEEEAAFRRGVCGRTGCDIADTDICGRPSKPGASFGNCDEDDAFLLVDYWPDGTPRWDTDPGYQSRPDYEQHRVLAMETHRRYCSDRDCRCQS